MLGLLDGWFCSGNCSYSESMSSTDCAMSKGQHFLSFLLILWVLDSLCPSSLVFYEPCRGLIKGQEHNSQLFLALWPVMIFCINHCLLQKGVSLTKEFHGLRAALIYEYKWIFGKQFDNMFVYPNNSNGFLSRDYGLPSSGFWPGQQASDPTRKQLVPP